MNERRCPCGLILWGPSPFGLCCRCRWSRRAAKRNVWKAEQREKTRVRRSARDAAQYALEAAEVAEIERRERRGT